MPSENYVISLQKVYDDKPRTRRANYAINVIFDFFKKHTRKDKKDIIISTEVNEYVWKRSIQKPPRKIAVSIKEDGGKVYVFLKDSKAFKEFGVTPVKKAKGKKEESKPEDTKTTNDKQKIQTKPKETTVKSEEVTTKKSEKTTLNKPKPKETNKVQEQRKTIEETKKVTQETINEKKE